MAAASSSALKPLQSPLEALMNVFQETATRTVIEVSGAFLFAYVTTRALEFLAEAYSRRNPKRGLVLKNLAYVARYIIYGGAVVYGVLSFHPDRNTLVALVGGSAVALGFAFQDIVLNWVAGGVLLFERPFRVGDVIHVGDYFGEVVNIGSRSFQLRSFNDTVVTVPHRKALADGVENSTRGRLESLVVIDFYVDHENDLGMIRDVLWEAAVTSKFVYPETTAVVLIEEQPWTTRFRIKAYVADARKEFQFVSDVTYNAKQVLDKVGIRYPRHCQIS